MTTTADYDDIVSNGFKPSRVVAGQFVYPGHSKDLYSQLNATSLVSRSKANEIQEDEQEGLYEAYERLCKLSQKEGRGSITKADIHAFLQAFHKISVRHGRENTLDEVLSHMDFLHHHFTQTKNKASSNPRFYALFHFAWLKFEEYYQLTEQAPVPGGNVQERTGNPGESMTEGQDGRACVKSPTVGVTCGLAQGSPVSPISCLLYTEPIYRMGKPEGRFGYADDTVILCTGQSLEETSGIASEYLQELVNWGAANGISFDPEKTEVMHFSPGRRETVLPVRHGDVEKQPEAAMRRLGLWLDRKLTFKTCGEVGSQGPGGRPPPPSLGNTRRGPKPSAVQRAVRACVEPILLFGVEAWYPGATAPRWRQPTKEGPSRTQQLVRKMSKALKQAIRAILEDHTDRCPAPRKRHASGSPTAGAPRPIIKCIKLKYQLPPKTFPTRLRRTNRLLGNCQRPVLMPRKYSHETQQPLQTASKEESAKDFDGWLQTIPALRLIVYSDGSLSSSGAAGYGYAVHQSGRSVCQGAGRLGPAEVFDAEAKGALEGLKAALRLSRSASQRIVVCLDNIAAAACLRGKPSDSSQRVFLTFQVLAKTHQKTEVRWIPGHTKIPGNEQADILAKTGCANPNPQTQSQHWPSCERPLDSGPRSRSKPGGMLLHLISTST
ncbi:reverse transcriptase domain protein [Metarhizium robertsii]|uniref:Reverse transcriptase domain protein n=1 Tax=Metarhizium robertsii TaxID=568076 RepID=A0A014P1Z3_9HYPO|nr:reverse transcriptase domain protein [Metarhizium robertsii]